MTATVVDREKYVRLMAEMSECEAPIAALETELAKVRATGSKDKVAILEGQLRSWQEKLADASTRLATVSNGCGSPHP